MPRTTAIEYPPASVYRTVRSDLAHAGWRSTSSSIDSDRKVMPKPLNPTILSRRNALLLAATASVGVTGEQLAFGSDSVKTGAHQEPGNCSTPRSAVAKTQYGKVRGFLVDG